jgi:hypothetical protein
LRSRWRARCLETFAGLSLSTLGARSRFVKGKRGVSRARRPAGVRATGCNPWPNCLRRGVRATRNLEITHGCLHMWVVFSCEGWLHVAAALQQRAGSAFSLLAARGNWFKRRAGQITRTPQPRQTHRSRLLHAVRGSSVARERTLPAHKLTQVAIQAESVCQDKSHAQVHTLEDLPGPPEVLIQSTPLIRGATTRYSRY